MKFSIELTYSTSPEWIKAVMNDFNSFLQDHADCERKASAMAMSFIAKCPDKTEIIPELIETAQEELEHFKEVYAVMEKRGVKLKSEMQEDMYIKKLLDSCRSGRDERLLDRMLLASIIECRGAERFKLVADNIQDEELKKFYKTLWISEAKHGNIFIKMALQYFSKEDVYKRLDELAMIEGKICESLPIKAALH